MNNCSLFIFSLLAMILETSSAHTHKSSGAEESQLALAFPWTDAQPCLQSSLSSFGLLLVLLYPFGGSVIRIIPTHLSDVKNVQELKDYRTSNNRFCGLSIDLMSICFGSLDSFIWHRSGVFPSLFLNEFKLLFSWTKQVRKSHTCPRIGMSTHRGNLKQLSI